MCVFHLLFNPVTRFNCKLNTLRSKLFIKLSFVLVLFILNIYIKKYINIVVCFIISYVLSSNSVGLTTRKMSAQLCCDYCSVYGVLENVWCSYNILYIFYEYLPTFYSIASMNTTVYV